MGMISNADKLNSTKRWHLLSVSAGSHSFEVIVLEDYILEERAREVLYDVPLDGKESLPFVFLPEIHGLLEVHWPKHLCQPHKLSTAIHLKQ